MRKSYFSKAFVSRRSTERDHWCKYLQLHKKYNCVGVSFCRTNPYPKMFSYARMCINTFLNPHWSTTWAWNDPMCLLWRWICILQQLQWFSPIFTSTLVQTMNQSFQGGVAMLVQVRRVIMPLLLQGAIEGPRPTGMAPQVWYCPIEPGHACLQLRQWRNDETQSRERWKGGAWNWAGNMHSEKPSVAFRFHL